MIKITFKNVEQGDSIILEWEGNNGKKIAVIDCKKCNNQNPVLDFVSTAGYSKIDFLIMSHPHLDHCSGFTELINHAINNKIQIGYFLHTANNAPAYWKAAINGKVAENEILELYKIIRSAKEKIGMKNNHIEGDTLVDPTINLSPEIKLTVLAPRSDDFDKYAKKVENFPFQEEDGNKASANWLSTLIKIQCENWYVLLTSDVSKDALIHYDIKKSSILKGKLVLAQIPHHGSFYNHNNTFWKNRKCASGTPIVISVGKNKYNHPSQEVVNFFRKTNFSIYATNEIGALKPIPITKQAKQVSEALDVFSTSTLVLKNDNLNGDKTFEIDKSGKVTAILNI